MLANPNLGNVSCYAYRMPHQIAEIERYMHDSTDAVFKKYSLATKFQKTAKFSGGIWDVNDTDMVSQSNEEDPADFLLNIISEGNDGCVQDMDEGENVLPEISKVFWSEDESVVKNKRLLTEELEDKTVLISDQETGKEMSRKRTKQTISFSNSPVKNETPETKPCGMESKSLVLESASSTDVSYGRKDAANIMAIASKRNNAVDDWWNLTSQCNGRDPISPSKELLLHPKVDNTLPRSQLSSKRVVSIQSKNNQDVQKMAVKPQKSSAVRTAVLKEANCIYPEDNKEVSKAWNLNVELKTEDKKKAINKIIEGHDSVLMNILQTSGQLRENSKEKDRVNGKAVSLGKSKMNNEGKSKIADSDILKNITELLGDSDFLTKEKIKGNSKTKKLVKGNTMSKMASVQRNKDIPKNYVKDSTIKLEQDVLMPDEQRSEDESHLVKSKLDKKKIENSSQTNLEIPSEVHDVLKPKDKTKKITKQASVTFNSDKMTSALDENHSNNFPSLFSQHASFNWRNDCINVRQSASKNGFKTSTSDSFNWRDHCIDSKISDKECEKVSTAYSLKRKDRHSYEKPNDANEIDETKDMETLDDEKLKRRLLKIALKVKEPDPLSRFQGIGNPDPESIWDSPAENKSSQIRMINKKYVKTEEIHTQTNETKKIKIPNFFGTPPKTFSKQSMKVEEKISPSKKSENSEWKGNDSRLSRSPKENYISSNTYRRSRYASVNWRNGFSVNNYSDNNDRIITVAVTDKKGKTIEELKTRNYVLFELKKEIKKLFHLIPDPDESDRPVKYSALAVQVFIRYLFSPSCTFPDWKTALETYAIAKKFDVEDLRKTCQEYFAIKNLPFQLVDKITEVAKSFNVIEALQSAKIFPEVQRCAESLEDSSSTCNESCVVSCITYVEPSELCIPLHYEDYRGIEGTNNCDIQNTVTFKCISGVIHMKGIQLQLQADDAFSKINELQMYCDVDKNGGKVFESDMCENGLISFGKELILKAGDELTINVLIEDISLRMCAQLEDEQFLSHDKFHAFFKSGKMNNNKKPLFFIKKIFYTFKSARK